MNQMVYTEAHCQTAVEKAVLGLFSPITSGLSTQVPSTFLSTIYCSLRLIINHEVRTAATDGKNLWFNPEWYCKISQRMQLTVLAHELWHCAFLHMGRLMGRDPSIWNAACDYAINWMLHSHGFVFDRLPNGDVHGLLDEQYKDMSADQIYALLLQNATPIELPFGADLIPSDVSGVDEIEIVRNVVRAVTMARINNEAGKLPGDLTSLVDELLQPKLPWEALLRRWLDDKGDEGFDWRRPSRRYAADGLYLPSKGGDGRLNELLWAFDTSGSMSNGQVAVCNSEMKGAKERLKPRRMTVVNFDTKIRGTWEFTDDDMLDRLEFTGRGGTNLTEVFELAARTKPRALIVLSDLACKIPPPIPGVAVLWVCLDNPSRNVDHGHIIHVDSRSPTKA